MLSISSQTEVAKQWCYMTVRLYSENRMWWHTRRNQIWSFSEMDESIFIGGGVSSVGCWQPKYAHRR